MTESSPIGFLAIDGGGTHCRAALQADGTVVCVEAGPANVSTDFERSIRNITDALQSLAAQSGLEFNALVRLPAFVGLAGVTGPKMAERVGAAIPLTNARIADDRPAALRGALGGEDGAIAHCGTGSFFGAQINGKATFAGGWGPVLGDEASAQWIGRTALRETLQVSDGFHEVTPLAQMFLRKFGDTAGVVRFGGSARPADFGALAPDVTQYAQEGDSLARRVMANGAAEIARSLTQVGWKPGMKICMTGGIGPFFKPFLPEQMQADTTEATGDPLTGALSLAQERALENAT